MTRGFCPSALGLMDNAQDIVLIRDFRKCEKYLTLPSLPGGVFSAASPRVKRLRGNAGVEFFMSLKTS